MAEKNKYLKLIPNYLYMYHTDQWLVLPEYPDSISDSLGSSFQETNALSRTAPVLSYNNSGPRKVQVQLHFHRDMLNEVNYQTSNMIVDIGEDYVDALLRQIQAIALPKYNASQKEVVPPMIAIRFGNDIFIKGVVNSGISIEYQKPILDNGKYSQITISFDVTETDPYDAESVQKLGSFRGITQAFKDGIYK